MIVARIDDHEGAGLHVTRNTCRRGTNTGMMAVLHVGVFVGRMALQADAFARCSKFRAVRLVAIAAGDAGGEHLALLERRIVIGLFDIANLAVGMIGIAREPFNCMGLRQPLTRHPIFVKSGAPRVA
jgi:hypothetical protein